MKKTAGIVSILVGLLLSFPVLADENAPPSSNSPTPSATGTNPPAQGGGMQRQDIRNDAQNYREADNDKKGDWKARREHRREEMRERREHRREEMKEHREHHHEGMKNPGEHPQPAGAPAAGTPAAGAPAATPATP